MPSIRGGRPARYSRLCSACMKGRWPPTTPSSSRCRSPPARARRARHAAVAGDHEAYAALLRPHERVAYRVAAAITGWNGNAEEATQNAFVKAYRSLPRFRVGAAFRPWLLRIVVNERTTCSGPSAATSGSAPGPPSATTRRSRARTRRCSRARRSRPSSARSPAVRPDRLAVVLRYFAELPDAEAAALLGTSREAYRVRLLRARRRLQALLEEADV